MDGIPVFNAYLGNRTRGLRLDLIHHLHCFNDAQSLPFGNGITHVHKGRSFRRRFAIEGSHHGRVDCFATRTLSGRRGIDGRIRDRCRSGNRWGRRSRRQSPLEVFQVSTLLKLNTKIFLFELEDREPMIIHELNDFSDFREVHEKVRVMGKRQALERL